MIATHEVYSILKKKTWNVLFRTKLEKYLCQETYLSYGKLEHDSGNFFTNLQESKMYERQENRKTNESDK